MKTLMLILFSLLVTSTSWSSYVPYPVSSGIEKQRIERVAFGGPGSQASPVACTSDPCTIYSQSGSWVTSIHWISQGNYIMTIASGVFKTTPICVASTSLATRVNWTIDIAPSSPTNVIISGDNQVSAVAADVTGGIICMGTR